MVKWSTSLIARFDAVEMASDENETATCGWQPDLAVATAFATFVIFSFFFATACDLFSLDFVIVFAGFATCSRSLTRWSCAEIISSMEMRRMFKPDALRISFRNILSQSGLSRVPRGPPFRPPRCEELKTMSAARGVKANMSAKGAEKAMPADVPSSCVAWCEYVKKDFEDTTK